MSALRETAMELIRNVPEDKLYYVVQIIDGVNKLYDTKDTDAKTRAFAEIEKLRKESPELDYDAELEEYRKEKYGA